MQHVGDAPSSGSGAPADREAAASPGLPALRRPRRQLARPPRSSTGERLGVQSRRRWRLQTVPARARCLGGGPPPCTGLLLGRRTADPRSRCQADAAAGKQQAKRRSRRRCPRACGVSVLLVDTTTRAGLPDETTCLSASHSLRRWASALGSTSLPSSLTRMSRRSSGVTGSMGADLVAGQHAAPGPRNRDAMGGAKSRRGRPVMTRTACPAEQGHCRPCLQGCLDPSSIPHPLAEAPARQDGPRLARVPRRHRRRDAGLVGPSLSDTSAFTSQAVSPLPAAPSCLICVSVTVPPHAWAHRTSIFRTRKRQTDCSCLPVRVFPSLAVLCAPFVHVPLLTRGLHVRTREPTGASATRVGLVLAEASAS